MTPNDDRPGEDRLPAAARVGRVALRVADLDETVGFYRDVVGLSVRSHEDGVARLGTAERELLVLREAPDAPPRPDDAAGLYHVAIRVPTRAALADALDRIRSAWRLDGASDHLVSEALYLQDPAGNGVEVYCDRPRAEWPTAEDGGVAMTTDPLDVADLSARAAGDESVPAGTDVGHVHLEVTSLDDAAGFYVDALGANVRQRMRGALFVAAGEYHHHVGCNVWNRRSEPAASGRGLAWFEIVVPDASVLDSARRRLEAAGYGTAPVEGTGASDGTAPGSDSRGFAVEDDDGLELHLRTAKR